MLPPGDLRHLLFELDDLGANRKRIRREDIDDGVDLALGDIWLGKGDRCGHGEFRVSGYSCRTLRPITCISTRALFLHEETWTGFVARSEEHTSELQSLTNLVCR